MSQRNQIEIDYCPSCRGVWLDKGELDKMLDYAANNSYAENQYYQQNTGLKNTKNQQVNYPNEGYKKPYKKKSFLNDLFDFD